MTIASKVQDYMNQRGANYDVVSHPHSRNSMETAELADVPADYLVKSVLLEDKDGAIMAVLPSTRHIRLGKLCRALNRRLRLMTEQDLSELFMDCEPGAIPPLGLAYGIRTVVDDSLANLQEIYFEAGDHEKLIHMKGDAFMALMQHAGHARFGYL